MRKTRHAGSYKAQADTIAKARGGDCLSQEIQSCTNFALWKCGVKEHPPWSAQFQLVRGFPSCAGTWCPVCGRERHRLSIEHVRQALLRRRIKLLSTEFNGVERPIRCECLQCGNPNNVRTAAKGRNLTCKGYGIAQVTPKQVEVFKKSPQMLREFYEEKWPDWEKFDRWAKFRLRFGKPVILSDGRRFASAGEAARHLGVTKASVLGAVRDGGKCCGFCVKRITRS